MKYVFAASLVAVGLVGGVQAQQVPPMPEEMTRMVKELQIELCYINTGLNALRHYDLDDTPMVAANARAAFAWSQMGKDTPEHFSALWRKVFVHDFKGRSEVERREQSNYCRLAGLARYAMLSAGNREAANQGAQQLLRKFAEEYDK